MNTGTPIGFTERDWVCGVSTGIPVPDDGVTSVEYWLIIAFGVDNHGNALVITHVFIQNFEAQARADKLRAAGVTVMGPMVHNKVYPASTEKGGD